MEKHLNKYLESLKYQRNYSNHTITNYKNDILDYVIYTKEKKISLELITYNEIQDYLLFLHDKNYTKTTINRKLSALRSFYKYLNEENILKKNPFKNINSLKKNKKLPNYLYTNEMQQLLDIEDKKNNLNIRNELIIELLYATGVRVSELVNIKLNDINFSNKTIRILGKGSKERIVMFGDYALEKMNNYITNCRNQLSKDNNEYLFLNSRGFKLSDRSIRTIINTQTSKAGLKQHITPHTIRHTFATHLLNEGAELTTVKELLGHKNLSTTSIYTHLSKEHLRNVYLNSHPRSKKKK